MKKLNLDESIDYLNVDCGYIDVENDDDYSELEIIEIANSKYIENNNLKVLEMKSKQIKDLKSSENEQPKEYPQQTKEVIFQDNCPYCNSNNVEWGEEHCIETEEWVCNDCKKHFNIRVETTRYVEKEIFARKCSQCNKVFNEGYCIDGGDRYYCSDECLYKNFTKEEWNEHYTDEGDSYWTEWECEEEFQYYADGSEIEEVEE